MSGNTESTSNSMKFAPMPMSVLLAQYMPIETSNTPDTSVEDDDDSDSSVSEITTKRTLAKPTQVKTELKFSPQNVKNNLLEKKVAHESYSGNNNKENISNNSLCNNWTYPNKDTNDSSKKSILNNVYPGSEIKKHVYGSEFRNSALSSQKVMCPIPVDQSLKKTPEASKLPKPSQKIKTATPKIKSGIRKFTPGSGRNTNRKTPQKSILNDNCKESVRCLFPDNPKEEVSNPAPPPQPVAETPSNRKPMPAPYVATPSYPQGMPRNQSKFHFKTTIIKGKTYMYIKKLGTGGSSEVFKVLEVGTSSEYAVKCVNLSTDPELARGYVNEVRLLRALQNSDRVIKMFSYQYERESKFLRVVLEVGETDLSSFLKARGAGLPPALVLYYWEEMLQAVSYIHEHGVIHADLKPANFLLVCGRLKLIDFGIASSISADATSVVRSQATGTYSYISPEALMGGAGGYGVGGSDGNAPIKISFRSDVWSLGCILYSMVYGRTPFGHIPNLAKLAVILDPNHRIEYPTAENFPASIIATMKWCLTYNARKRPSTKELLAIPHMQGSPLPTPLLEKLRHHLTPEEYETIKRARV